MARFGFVGASYQSQSLNADAQRLQNWYLENDESGSGASAATLYPRPGLELFCTLPDSPVRAEFAFNGRFFVVAGSTLFEVKSDGTFTNLGALADDGNPAQMAANVNEVLVVSGGSAYFLTLATNVLVKLDTTSGNVIQGPVSQCGGADGYLIVLLADSQRIQISALEDASTWSTLGVPNLDQVNEFPDLVLGMLVDHRQLWLFGEKATLPYYDSGSANIFDPVPGGYQEQGIIAPWSPAKMDNSVFWLGGSDRGNGIAWKAQGYQPTRISNNAVEAAWASYSTMADAVGFAYEDQGHTFWCLRFPTANKTWVFDAATGMWHERSSWNPKQGKEQAFLAGYHTFIFAKHLVGDWSSGNIYQMAIPSINPATGEWQFVTDNGAQVNRVRRAPHITTEKQWAFHSQLQVNIEAGVGPQPPLKDGNGNPRAPQLMLRWSDDGGHRWSDMLACGFGQAGETNARAIWRRLGKSRDRIYEVSCSDPVPARIVDAYLEANPGFAPQDSLYAQIRKVT